MRKPVLLVAALLLSAAGAFVVTNLGGSAPASATTPQLSVTGKLVVGNYAQAGEPVMLQFTVHNQSSSQYWPFYLSYFVSSNGSVVQIVCTGNPQGSIVGGDLENNTCSGYALGAHRSYQSAILVNANSDPPNLTVVACAGVTPGATTFCDWQSILLND